MRHFVTVKTTSKEFLLYDMIQKMFKEDDTRLTPAEILYHPYFWNSSTSIELLCEIVKNLEDYRAQLKSTNPQPYPMLELLQDSINQNSNGVIGMNWKERIDELLVNSLEFISESSKKKKPKNIYDGTLITELIRGFRNKWSHQEEKLKILFGNFFKDEYLNYYLERFPKLLVHIYQVIEGDSQLKEAYQLYFAKNRSKTNLSPHLSEKYKDGVVNIKLDFEGKVQYPKPSSKIESLDIVHLNCVEFKKEKKLIKFVNANCQNIKRISFNYSSLDLLFMAQICQRLPLLTDIDIRGSKNIYQNGKIPIDFQPPFTKLQILKISNSEFFDIFQKAMKLTRILLNLENLCYLPKVPISFMELIHQQKNLKCLEIQNSLDGFHFKDLIIPFQLNTLILTHPQGCSNAIKKISEFVQGQNELESIYVKCFNDIRVFDCINVNLIYDSLFNGKRLKSVQLELNSCIRKSLERSKIQNESLKVLTINLIYKQKQYERMHCKLCSSSDETKCFCCLHASTTAHLTKIFPKLEELNILEATATRSDFITEGSSPECLENFLAPLKKFRLLNKFMFYALELKHLKWFPDLKFHRLSELSLKFVDYENDEFENQLSEINLDVFEKFFKRTTSISDVNIQNFDIDIYKPKSEATINFIVELLKVISEAPKICRFELNSKRNITTVEIDSDDYKKVPAFLKQPLNNIMKDESISFFRIFVFEKPRRRLFIEY